jgi:hypothetical protein
MVFPFLNMYIYKYIYICIYMYIYISIYLYLYIYMCMNIYAVMHIVKYKFLCIFTYLYDVLIHIYLFYLYRTEISSLLYIDILHLNVYMILHAYMFLKCIVRYKFVRICICIHILMFI